MYEELKKIIDNSHKIVFFGGAGVSTESGVPDFRSENGLWNAKTRFNCTPEEIVNRPDFSVLAVGEGEAESGHLAAILSELRGENRLVSLSYRLDDGTMIHLEERIRRIREERQQQPGSAERD